ncbi:hypothetical protein BGX31_009707 [Mortierella sp. GBA43]|nr:hypothetical protein BGX31_009707 [Mortierella sp. GBA43]
MMPVHSFVEAKGLYVTGGVQYYGVNSNESTRTDYIAAKQTFMLNLAVSWSVAAPAFVKLGTGNAPPAPMAAAVSADGKSWLVIGTDHSWYNYDFAVEQWAPTTWDGTKNITNFPGDVTAAAATDPSSGTIYVPGGFYTGGGFRMAKVGAGYPAVPNSIPMYKGGEAPQSRLAAWSESLQSVIEFNEATGKLRAFKEENGLNGRWQDLNSTGGPGPRIGACLVPAYGGSKMIIFGGHKKFMSRGDVLVFDVLTQQWTKGTDAPVGQERDSMACATSYDSLIVWGGVNSQKSKIQDSQPLVYNMFTKQWINQYVAEPRPTPTPVFTSATGSGSGASPTSSFSSSPSGQGQGSSSTRLIVVLGSVLGTLILVIAIGGWLIVRYRSKKPRTIGATTKDSADDRGDHKLDPKDPKLFHGLTGADHYGATGADYYGATGADYYGAEFLEDERYPMNHMEYEPPMLIQRSYSPAPSSVASYPRPPPSLVTRDQRPSMDYYQASQATDSYFPPPGTNSSLFPPTIPDQSLYCSSPTTTSRSPSAWGHSTDRSSSARNGSGSERNFMRKGPQEGARGTEFAPVHPHTSVVYDSSLSVSDSSHRPRYPGHNPHAVPVDVKVMVPDAYTDDYEDRHEDRHPGHNPHAVPVDVKVMVPNEYTDDYEDRHPSGR